MVYNSMKSCRAPSCFSAIFNMWHPKVALGAPFLAAQPQRENRMESHILQVGMGQTWKKCSPFHSHALAKSQPRGVPKCTGGWTLCSHCSSRRQRWVGFGGTSSSLAMHLKGKSIPGFLLGGHFPSWRKLTIFGHKPRRTGHCFYHQGRQDG